MFGKTNKTQQINSIVGNKTNIRGDLHFSGGLHIDGSVKGNVVAESDGSVLTISDNGLVEGDVRVHNIVLNGEVKGDVYSTQHIELAPNARVNGNVYYKVIEMAMGASVNGSLIHMYEETAAQPLSQERKSA